MDLDAVSDVALAQRAQEGDEEAYAVLAHRHAAPVAAYLGGRIRRVDVVDELVIDVICAGWNYLHKYRPSQSFAAWFRSLAAELARIWHRDHPDESLRGSFPYECCPDEASRERMRWLEQALDRLNDKARMAIEHRFRGGLDDEALAEAMHVADVADAKRQIGRIVSLLAQMPPPQ